MRLENHSSPSNASGITRLRIVGFLAGITLLTVCLAAVCLYTLSGRPSETALALCGVAIAGYLLKEGKRRWNFTEIEAAGDYHLNLAYESDRNYQELLEVLARVRQDGWENLNLEDKVRIRHRVEALVEKEPLPRDYLATADTVENLRVISKTGGQRPNSIKR
jgi:hypothetical protein